MINSISEGYITFEKTYIVRAIKAIQRPELGHIVVLIDGIGAADEFIMEMILTVASLFNTYKCQCTILMGGTLGKGVEKHVPREFLR